MIPDGWLIEPNSKWLLLFHKDRKSLNRITTIYIDKWEVSKNGTPSRFVNRRKVQLEPAIETWTELMNNGWQNIQHKFGQTA